MKLDVNESLFLKWLGLFEEHQGKNRRSKCRICGEDLYFCRCLEDLAEDILETRGEYKGEIKMLNTKCPKCGGLFDSMDIKIKRVDDIGICADTLVFDCPCCGEEIAEIDCDGVE